MTTIDLINAAKFYKGLEHQDGALKYLQTKIPVDVVIEFAKRWRAAPTPAPIVTATEAQQIFGRAATEAQLKDLNACMVRFAITTVPRIRHFMSQVATESAGLQYIEEIATGDKYEGRDDLGNVQPGDGRKFRGVGFIQVTGRYWYEKFAIAVNDPNVVEIGCSYVAKKYPATISGFWWSQNNMNKLCDSGADVWAISRAVNLGSPFSSATPNGMDDRIHYYKKACEVIKS